MEYLRVVKDFLRYYTTYTKTKNSYFKQWEKEHQSINPRID